MQVNLVMFRQDGRRKDFPLSQPITTIGRQTDCSLQVPLQGVSRQHCRLVIEGQQLKLQDLASSNGTYVNAKRVTEATLKPGDRVTIGPVVFTVQIDGEPAAVRPQAAPKPKSAEEEAAILLDSESSDIDPISALEALAEDSEQDQK